MVFKRKNKQLTTGVGTVSTLSSLRSTETSCNLFYGLILYPKYRFHWFRVSEQTKETRWVEEYPNENLRQQRKQKQTNQQIYNNDSETEPLQPVIRSQSNLDPQGLHSIQDLPPPFFRNVIRDPSRQNDRPLVQDSLRHGSSKRVVSRPHTLWTVPTRTMSSLGRPSLDTHRTEYLYVPRNRTLGHGHSGVSWSEYCRSYWDTWGYTTFIGVELNQIKSSVNNPRMILFIKRTCINKKH